MAVWGPIIFATRRERAPDRSDPGPGSPPRSFYDDFPGLGRAWVSVDGPCNEHLVRDVVSSLFGLALFALVPVALIIWPAPVADGKHPVPAGRARAPRPPLAGQATRH